jgi:tRNA(Leu) C34 or U34 (ribose-2'-O)-methylase TrmL
MYGVADKQVISFDWLYEKYADRLDRIPMWSDRARLPNLSTSAGVSLCEALRQTGKPAHRTFFGHEPG